MLHAPLPEQGLTARAYRDALARRIKAMVRKEIQERGQASAAAIMEPLVDLSRTDRLPLESAVDVMVETLDVLWEATGASPFRVPRSAVRHNPAMAEAIKEDDLQEYVSNVLL